EVRRADQLRSVGGARDWNPCRLAPEYAGTNVVGGTEIDRSTFTTVVAAACVNVTLRKRQTTQSGECGALQALRPTSSTCAPEFRLDCAIDPSNTLAAAGSANCSADRHSIRKRIARRVRGPIK